MKESLEEGCGNLKFWYKSYWWSGLCGRSIAKEEKDQCETVSMVSVSIIFVFRFTYFIQVKLLHVVNFTCFDCWGDDVLRA